jgi:hypothetical protein
LNSYGSENYMVFAANFDGANPVFVKKKHLIREAAIN